MSIQSFLRSRCLSAASRRWVALACGTVLECCFASVATARQIVVIIQPPVDSHARAFIEVTGDPVRIWSFPNSYAGVTELGSRIERLEEFDTAGAEISVRKIAPGQFEAAMPAVRFRYEVNLAPPAQPSDAARVSWLTYSRGLLMLADLFPANRSEEGKAAGGQQRGTRTESTIVRFMVPNSWAVYSNESQNGAGDFAGIAGNGVQKQIAFAVTDVDRAVFPVGAQNGPGSFRINAFEAGYLDPSSFSATCDREHMERRNSGFDSHIVVGKASVKDGRVVAVKRAADP